MIKTMKCHVCGSLTQRKSAVQKYCPSCSAEKAKERGRRWARSNPPDDKQKKRNSELAKARQEEVRKIGEEASAASAETIAWPSWESPDLAWIARVSVPFTFAYSKNAVWRNNGRGHVYMRDEARRARKLLASKISEAASRVAISTQKLWVDVFVQMPNHRGDSHNVIPSVCDAIQDGTGLDDRWYCIRKLDWQIVKVDPRLFVGFGQESSEDMRACSICGLLKPSCSFTKDRGSKLGIGRECRSCRRRVPAARRNKTS